MPIYEYECDKGCHFEVTQRISEDRLDSCIECGAPAERLISASSFHLKGGGWYAQGYGGGSSKGESSSTSSSTTKSATEAGAIKSSSSSDASSSGSSGDD